MKTNLNALLPLARLRRLARPGADGNGLSRFLADPRAHAPALVAGLLGLALAAQLVRTTGTLLSALGAVRDPAAASATHRMRPSRARAMGAEATIAAHLFGASPEAAEAAPAAMVDTTLVLTGIVATDDPHEGFAMLGASPTATRLYHTGDAAEAGSVLLEVYADRVVVQRGAALLTLRLPNQLMLSPTGISTVTPLAAAIEEEAPSQALDDESRHFRPRPLSDVGSLTRAFNLRPATFNGEHAMRIMDVGQNRTTLAALGLAPGDIILGVDGSPMGNPQAALDKALQSGGATLDIARAGARIGVAIDPATAEQAAGIYRQANPQ